MTKPGLLLKLPRMTTLKKFTHDIKTAKSAHIKTHSALENDPQKLKVVSEDAEWHLVYESREKLQKMYIQLWQFQK